MNPAIKRIAMIVSLLALLLILWASVSVYSGRATFSSYLQWTGWLTLCWFLLAPLWLWKK